MKIVIVDAITLGDDINLDIFKDFGEVEVFEKTAPEETLKRVKDADIVITNKVVIDKDIMQNSNIKLICIAATGINNVDLEAAKRLGVRVKNVAGYSTNSVIQHTFAMALYLLEQLKYYDEFVKSKGWSRSGVFTNLDRKFFEIAGKTWGIIGLGEIGRGVAKVAKAFGANIIYYSTTQKNQNREFERVELEELLQRADIISIHAPLNEKTLNLLNSSNLALLKEGAILLNLGRGGIVNEKDLAETIDSKNIYVGLDVTNKEPIEEDNPLLKVKRRDNLLITPHIAWTSKEAREKLIKGVYKNIEEFIKESSNG
ncbi:MAG: D-2-hydroxyacid dehydrogenase [Epsilonproteobacteria bacterium]|nr:D-2-hydroxyacid dehydrogenase [Campylobacterota bacterium]